MYHFSRYVTDASGNVQTSGTVTVTLTGGGTPTIYSDNAGSTKANPFSIPGTGLVDFYIANSHFDVQAVTPAGTVTLSGQVALDTDSLAGNITVTDNLTVSGTLTAASFSPSVVNTAARQDIASSATVNLDSSTSNYVRITGSATITGITLSDGRDRDIVFAGGAILTNGASLILPGGANITTAAGDTMRVRGESGGIVRVIDYTVAALSTNDTSLTKTIASGNISTSGDTTISIPAGAWKELTVQLVGITASTDFIPYIRVNGDTGTNYDYQNMWQTTGSTAGSSGVGATAIALSRNDGLTDDSGTTQNPLDITLTIQNPAGTSSHKNIGTVVPSWRENGGSIFSSKGGGRWKSTAAITSLNVLLRGSIGTSPTGSTINATAGTYVVRGYL